MVTDPTVRPRQRLTPDERRAQLCTAAIAIIAEDGYVAATADAIARRAGVSKGLLWHHFADRDDLLHETAIRALATLRSAVGAQLDLTAAAPTVIRAALHGAAALVQTHAAERHALSEIVVNLRAPDGSLRLGLADYQETYASQAAIFRRGQGEGDIRADLDPLVLAVTYQGAVDGMLGLLETHPDTDPAQVADAVADVLLRGAVTPRGRRR